MIDWINLLKDCSQRIRSQVLALFRSAEAGVGFGVGAGGDVMKKIDLVAEDALIATLQDHHVSCTLISEETGIKKIGPEPSDFYVTTDPLDGTTNAVRGIPFMATSIAVSTAPYLRDVETALVSDLLHDVTYTAQKGQGALRNEHKIKPSSTSSLEKAVIGVDFNTFKIREIVTRLAVAFERTKHLRHLGANALEVCYVADGTIDAFLDLRGKLRVTDIAAAYLILREAGGLMVTPEGAEMNVPLSPTQRVSFIATANRSLCKAIREGLASAGRQ
ncbi:MAG: inositol monophosphatase family protein [Candidatus Bathyarchaeia archaeon]